MDKTRSKNLLQVILAILVLIAFYLAGKFLDINVIVEFAAPLAAAVITWIIYLVQKWTGLRLDFLDSEFTRKKVEEAIIWAEGCAVQKFKLDKFMTDGKEKMNSAITTLLSSLPNMDRVKAEKLIAYYFPQVRPVTEKMWYELAAEMKAKDSLKVAGAKKST